MKIVHCPEVVGGNPGALAVAEREVGLQSRCIAYSRGKFRYPVDEALWGERTPGFLIRNLLKAKLFLRLMDADWVHFNFGQSLIQFRFRKGWKRILNGFNFLDVKLLKLIGKRIAVTFQGTDARQGDVARRKYEIHFAHEVGNDAAGALRDEERRAMIRLWDRHADCLFALNPDLMPLLPERARFMAYAHVDFRMVQPEMRPRSRPLRVGHAPSNRKVKGSAYLFEAIEKLRAEGHPIELVLVENLTNAEALEKYRSCDVLVDQLLAGWYGGLAVEVLAMGIPVVCYIRDEDLAFVPREMVADLPLVTARPGTIGRVLLELLRMTDEEFSALQRRSRSFVEKWHDPVRIALELKQIYEDLGKPDR